MKQFGYCIWLHVHEPDSIYKADFPLHLTLERDIDNVEDAIAQYSFWKENIKSPLHCRFDKMYNEYEDNFAALYYFINVLDEKPNWWYEDAHVSLEYGYDKEIVVQDKHEALEGQVILLDKVSLFYCDGHYLKWKEVILDKSM